MSLYDYETSLRISAEDYPFYALLMAAMRKADSDNWEILQKAFPEIGVEFAERYNSSYGRLPSDPPRNDP